MAKDVLALMTGAALVLFGCGGIDPEAGRGQAQVELSGSCDGYCGWMSAGSCWCDDRCADYNDCCDDFLRLCVEDPCAEVSCDVPRRPICADAETLRTFSAGSCVDGLCDYPFDDLKCPGGCSDDGSGAACLDGCAEASCGTSDACCPGGCNANLDPDCQPVCGNAVVEEGESCDGDCPESCLDDEACAVATLSGSADGCDAVCVVEPIAECTSGDGCCPSGCGVHDDGDCGCASDGDCASGLCVAGGCYTKQDHEQGGAGFDNIDLVVAESHADGSLMVLTVPNVSFSDRRLHIAHGTLNGWSVSTGYKPGSWLSAFAPGADGRARLAYIRGTTNYVVPGVAFSGGAIDTRADALGVGYRGNGEVRAATHYDEELKLWEVSGHEWRSQVVHGETNSDWASLAVRFDAAGNPEVLMLDDWNHLYRFREGLAGWQRETLYSLGGYHNERALFNHDASGRTYVAIAWDVIPQGSWGDMTAKLLEIDDSGVAREVEFVSGMYQSYLASQPKLGPNGDVFILVVGQYESSMDGRKLWLYRVAADDSVHATAVDVYNTHDTADLAVTPDGRVYLFRARHYHPMAVRVFSPAS